MVYLLQVKSSDSAPSSIRAACIQETDFSNLLGLNIYITKLPIHPTNVAHQIPSFRRWSRPLKIHGIVLWRILSKNIHAIVGVLHLPNPPYSIDHSVMEIEYWITGGRKEILWKLVILISKAHGDTYPARIPTNGVVATHMNTPVIPGLVTQHIGLEAIDCWVFGDESICVVIECHCSRVYIHVSA